MDKASRKKKTSEDAIRQGRGGRLESAPPSPVAAALPETPHRNAFPLMLAAVVAVSFVAYLNTLFNSFVYDDMLQVLHNPWIRDARHLPEIFSKGVWGFRGQDTIANYYRPLMHVIYMVNYFLFGLKPWGYHLVNVLFHAGNALLVFIMASRLSRQFSFQSPDPAATSFSAFLTPPFLAALFFAVHPIHTEAVAWVGAITDLSCTFFYLLSLFLYIRHNTEGKKKYDYVFSLGAFSAALLCKEPAATLPLVLVAYDLAFGKPGVRPAVLVKRYVPFFVVTGIYLVVRTSVLGSFSPVKTHGELSAYEQIINVFPLFAKYLERLVLPINLNAFYPLHPITSLFGAKGMLSVLVTAGYITLTALAYRKNRTAFFCLAMIVVPLLPVLYIPALGDASLAERYLYLPSVGFAILLAFAFAWAREKMPRYGFAAITAALLLTLLYSVQTVSRNAIWKDNLTLFSDTVKKSPDAELPRGMLGVALMEAGRPDEAITEFRSTLTLNPDSANAHYNLGLTLFFKKGRAEEAIPEFQKALALTPKDRDARRHLAKAYAKAGMMDEALEQYRFVDKSGPNSLETYINLGRELEQHGFMNEAIALYKKALVLDQDYAEAHYALENAWLHSGQIDKAIERYQAAVRSKPGNAFYRNILGAAYAHSKLYDKAIEQFEAAVRLDPSNPAYKKNLDAIRDLKSSSEKSASNADVQKGK